MQCQRTQSAKLIIINLNSGGRKAMRVYITKASFNIILLYQLQHPKNLSTQQTASDTTKFYPDSFFRARCEKNPRRISTHYLFARKNDQYDHKMHQNPPFMIMMVRKLYHVKYSEK